MNQIMACDLLGAKPLSKPIPGHCLLNPWKQTLVTLQFKTSKDLRLSTYIVEVRLMKGAIFVTCYWRSRNLISLLITNNDKNVRNALLFLSK